MTLAASTYFEHLKAYVNSRYVMHDGVGGEVILKEKYFPPTGTRAKTRKIQLLLPGPGLAFKLDHDQVELQRKKSKPPLFHFLDDTAKPWSKRCDFVIFYVNGQRFYADCIEFKSKSLTAEKIVPQLRAGACWVHSLKRTIEHYTGDKRRIHLRKFVFAENDNPDAYLEPNRQLRADPSIRYYHFDEVHGQALAELQNTSIQEI
ncbi:hypothetical protein ACN2MM_09695 [Alkalilimnicola ehrlichii MLHE-1]|uniref:Uncharacterized protein n=1 Tax=Alkalilimnicola ehrlichii (strain ATCC BAA-1101 / DSM 17681 / MLHE-1) TaxID=187272 RepID=Q0A7Q3_ALKEH|nr:hypothetical protein [Alkalilimnicola ehrlichii]ABI57134.1 hypothetical protein Mlg_1790 [Alkalilimnicola ehrlichii MLHE-1]